MNKKVSENDLSHANHTVRLGGFQAWLTWIIGTVFVLFLFNLQTGYNVLNSDIQQEVGLTLIQVSAIASVYTLIFAIAQLFSGSLLDRFGVRLLIPCAIFIVTLGAFILAQAHNYKMILLSQVVMALGAAFGFVGAGYIGGKWFGMAKFGFMFGLVQASASFGSLFGGELINLALSKMPWRSVIDYFVYFGLGLTVIGFLCVKDPEPINQQHHQNVFKEVFFSLKEVLKNHQIWLNCLTGAFLFGGLLSLAVVWGAKIIHAHCICISVEKANFASLMIWLGLGIGSIFIDKVCDIFKFRKHVIIGSSIIFASAVLILVYVHQNFIMACIIMFIVGLANAGHMISFTISAELVPIELTGTSAALTNGAMFIVGGLLISIPGRIIAFEGGMSLEHLQSAMLPIVIINVVLAVICIFFLQETYHLNKTPK